MKLSIIIPCYNEKDTILQVLDKIYNLSLPVEKEIIIVDDGSTDGTGNILREHSKSPGSTVKLIFHEKNLGKGAAISTGVGQAVGDHIIIQDADLELDPGDYGALLEPILKDGASVVFGSRKKKGFKKIYFHSRFANFVVTWITNFLYGSKLTDQACGYKLVPIELFRELNIKSNGFEFCAELTAKILNTKKHEIREVDVEYYPRSYKEGKKINWKDSFIVVWTLVKNKFL